VESILQIRRHESVNEVCVAVVRPLRFLFLLCLISVGSCSDGSDPPPAELTTPLSDCFWQITGSPGSNEEDNRTWTDLNASYGNAIYAFPEPGAYITLENKFPYARFMSFSTYGIAGGIVDTLLDEDIVPDIGSTNPFVAGNPRGDLSRVYSVTIRDDEQLSQQNGLTSGRAALLQYRVYLSDAGTSPLGDAGLPRVTLHLPDGSIVQGDEACAALNIPLPGRPVSNIWWTETEYAEARGSSDPSQNPPVIRATYNFPFQKQCDFGGDCSTVPDGGLKYPFPDPRYLYSFISRRHGEVLVLRGKLPETPRTHLDAAHAATEGQLRYWSICNYEYYSARAEACLVDELVQVDEDGFYTIVVSRNEDLPSNASSECGVSHLGWSELGDGFGLEEGRDNHSDDGFLIVRNIVPSPSFTQAIPSPDALDEEEEIMGEFLTKGRYFSKAEFEDLGCDPWRALPYNEM
jgi:hypothetical protein